MLNILCRMLHSCIYNLTWCECLKKSRVRGALYFISTLPFVHCKFTVNSPRDVNNSLICGEHEFRCVHCSRREASEKWSEKFTSWDLLTQAGCRCAVVMYVNTLKRAMYQSECCWSILAPEGCVMLGWKQRHESRPWKHIRADNNGRKIFSFIIL